MGSDTILAVKNLNYCFCYSHFDLVFDILVRHGVVHLVYDDVVVELDGSLSPIRQFEAGSRQCRQQRLFFPKKQTEPAAFFLLK